MSRDIARREFLVGMAGALALVFLPLEEFLAKIAGIFTRAREAVRGARIYEYESLTVTFARQPEYIYRQSYEKNYGALRVRA